MACQGNERLGKEIGRTEYSSGRSEWHLLEHLMAFFLAMRTLVLGAEQAQAEILDELLAVQEQPQSSCV